VNLRASRANRARRYRDGIKRFILFESQKLKVERNRHLSTDISLIRLTNTIVLESIFDFEILTSYPYD